MWKYLEDVQKYFDPNIFPKYGRVFGKIWTATAFKGASGELATLTSIQHHYLNHLSWMDLMKDKLDNKLLEFVGVALTGWSRYDHFIGLCELLPQGIPSLVFNLQVMQYGPLSVAMKRNITLQLGCSEDVPWFGEFPDELNPTLTCQFPGHDLYEAILPYGALLKSIRGNLQFAQRYVTGYNLAEGDLHKKRSTQVVKKLRADYEKLNKFRKQFINASEKVLYEDAISEWLSIYFLPTFDKVYEILLAIKKQEGVKSWLARGRVTIKTYPDQI